MHPRRPAVLARLAVAVLAAVLLPAAAGAQPFGAWAIFDGPVTGDYFQIAHSPALNPTGAITIEGWVDVEDPPGGLECASIVGKGYLDAWWVGVCDGMLRSYLRGGTSRRTAGMLPSGWHHFAVTFNGAQRCHYIDGEVAMCWVEPGALTTNSEPVRIGSDVDWNAPPDGAINEIRLWNVARTTSQLRATINVPITAPQPGLVAVWAGGSAMDVVGTHDAVVVGTVPALTFPVTLAGCTTTPAVLCVRDRFTVTARWKTTGGSGPAGVAPLSTFQSGIFWFFNATNWEVMVKVLDACGINGRYWVFSAATTNVFYRMEVFDQEAGVNKVYFNYPGPPAPAVTDVNAFATCP